MVWIFWWQLIGTSAMVLFEYCFLARCLSLLPRNRQDEMSLELVKRTFMSVPVKGNVLQGLPATGAVRDTGTPRKTSIAPGAGCDLRTVIR